MVCRICLMDSTHSMDIFGLKGKQLNIAEIVGQHFWFEPKKDDNVSKSICSDCWRHIDNFHSFYLRVEEVQKNFSSETSIELIPAGEIKAEAEDYSFPDAGGISGPYDQDIKTLMPITLLKIDEVSHQNLSFVEENKGAINFPLSHDNETTDLNHLSQTNQLRVGTDDESSDEEVLKCTDKQQKSLPEFVKKLDSIDVKIAGFMKLKCEQCEYEGKTFANVKKHYENKHQVKGFVSCCKKKFRKRAYLFDHIEQHINPECFKCVECNKTFINRKSLRQHLKIHSATIIKSFKCDECSRDFRTKTHLSHHKFTHIPLEERKFFCDECKKPFGSDVLLRRHKRYVHENVYGKMCDICAKLIRGKKKFARHQLLHQGIVQPEFKCDICGALFKSQDGHKLHILSHTDTNEYICKICDGKFKSKNNLARHIRYVHTSACYKCTICDKSFKMKIKLTEHFATHTGEKLYNCPYCPKSFTWNSSFHEHKKKAHPVEWAEYRKKNLNN